MILDTKPAVDEVRQSVYDTKDYIISVPSTSNIQNSRSTEYKCDICSHIFRSAAKLNVHQQQGCEGLIEINSSVSDCKASALDCSNFECDIKIDEHQTVAEGIVSFKRDTKQPTTAGREKKLTGNKKQNNTTQQDSDDTTLKKRYKCELCDRTYRSRSGLSHHRNTHTGNRPFKCPLCNKS